MISFSLAIEHFHNAHITLCFPPSPKKGIVEIQFLFGNLSTPVKPPGEIGNNRCAKFSRGPISKANEMVNRLL